MSPQWPLLLQYAIVALAVAISAWVVLNQQCPAIVRRLRISLALPLVREGRSAWMRAFGKWIAPAPKPSGDGCGGCNSCDTGNAS